MTTVFLTLALHEESDPSLNVIGMDVLSPIPTLMSKTFGLEIKDIIGNSKNTASFIDCLSTGIFVTSCTELIGC